jgi:hypothetical protein
MHRSKESDLLTAEYGLLILAKIGSRRRLLASRKISH